VGPATLLPDPRVTECVTGSTSPSTEGRLWSAGRDLRPRDLAPWSRGAGHRTRGITLGAGSAPIVTARAVDGAVASFPPRASLSARAPRRRPARPVTPWRVFGRRRVEAAPPPGNKFPGYTSEVCSPAGEHTEQHRPARHHRGSERDARCTVSRRSRTPSEDVSIGIQFRPPVHVARRDRSVFPPSGETSFV
jgi:hypothetical protein